MKIKARVLAATLSAAVICPAFAMNAHAEGTIEDVYDAIREIGFGEAYIQQFKNKFATIPHDENGMTVEGTYMEYADWADMIIVYQDKITQRLAMEFGIDPEAVKTADPSLYLEPVPSTEVTTTTKLAETTKPVTDENGEIVSQTTVSSAATTEGTTTTAVTNGGGHSQEQENAFVKMSLEEKKKFISSLPEDQRAAYLAGLTPAERKSLLKQVGKDVQADILKDFVDAGETLGMHVSIDKVGEGQIDYSVRDSDGTLVDSSSFGSTVDDTGWNMTLPVVGSAGTILLSIGGFGWTAYRTNKRREEVLNDEQH
ncbi:MAG: hypothetical protein IK130_10605 [Oscillospiraceae bacterium]|nr:hypothetical protein [Oscillospiraceae bacterium]